MLSPYAQSPSSGSFPAAVAEQQVQAMPAASQAPGLQPSPPALSPGQLGRHKCTRAEGSATQAACSYSKLSEPQLRGSREDFRGAGEPPGDLPWTSRALQHQTMPYKEKGTAPVSQLWLFTLPLPAQQLLFIYEVTQKGYDSSPNSSPFYSESCKSQHCLSRDCLCR